MKLSVFLILVSFLIYIDASTTIKPSHHIAKHVAEDATYSQEDKHSEHKGHKKSGKESKHHVETANKGQHGSISHKIADDEKALKKTTANSANNHQSHKKAQGHQEHGAKFAEAAKRKKSNVAKGFHEKFHKNEQKQHDSFYSHGKKSGDWKSFGVKRSNFGNAKFVKDEHKTKISMKSLSKNGKSGKKSTAHNIEDHKSRRTEKSKKQHHDKQTKYRRKHSNPADKHKYKYSQVLH